MLDQADVFVLFDDAAFSKNSWHNRNRIRVSSGLGYVTIPVKKSGHSGQYINEVHLVSTIFLKKMCRTIEQSYSNALYFDKYYSSFADELTRSVADGKLLSVNYSMIKWILKELHLEKEVVLSSDLCVSGKRTEYVMEICKLLEANVYLSPAGAEQYLLEDQSIINNYDIKVVLQVYNHPEYNQCYKPFVPYASTLDLLFNCGPDSLNIIRSGRCKPRDLGA